MTEKEYREAISAVCPHCRAGQVSRYRPETNEWVHDIAVTTTRGGMSHTICWASGFRTSRFNEGFEDGQPVSEQALPLRGGKP